MVFNMFNLCITFCIPNMSPGDQYVKHLATMKEHD